MSKKIDRAKMLEQIRAEFPGGVLEGKGRYKYDFSEDQSAWLHDNVGKNYTLKYNLNVRFGPGTGYAKKTYNQLTPNAKKNALKTGVLKAGTTVTCLEVKYLPNQV